MKIRNGFVSNSSSSSFCIYGAQGRVTIDDMPKIKNAFPELYQSKIEELKKSSSSWRSDFATIIENIGNTEFFADIKKRGCEHKEVEGAKFCPECGKLTWIIESNPNIKKLESLNDSSDVLAFMTGLEHIRGQEESYIGRSWSSIQDHETGATFKHSVDEILMVINGKKGSTCEEAWYDG